MLSTEDYQSWIQLDPSQVMHEESPTLLTCFLLGALWKLCCFLQHLLWRPKAMLLLPF